MGWRVIWEIVSFWSLKRQDWLRSTGQRVQREKRREPREETFRVTNMVMGGLGWGSLQNSLRGAISTLKDAGQCVSTVRTHLEELHSHLLLKCLRKAICLEFI